MPPYQLLVIWGHIFNCAFFCRLVFTIHDMTIWKLLEVMAGHLV